MGGRQPLEPPRFLRHCEVLAIGPAGSGQGPGHRQQSILVTAPMCYLAQGPPCLCYTQIAASMKLPKFKSEVQISYILPACLGYPTLIRQVQFLIVAWSSRQMICSCNNLLQGVKISRMMLTLYLSGLPLNSSVNICLSLENKLISICQLLSY